MTHDLAKFCRLLLRRNGYVLEQLLSPARRVVRRRSTRRWWRSPRPASAATTRTTTSASRGRSGGCSRRTGELKPLLYTFRVLCTGIHLMRTGEVEADLDEARPRPGLPAGPGRGQARRPSTARSRRTLPAGTVSPPTSRPCGRAWRRSGTGRRCPSGPRPNPPCTTSSYAPGWELTAQVITLA